MKTESERIEAIMNRKEVDPVHVVTRGVYKGHDTTEVHDIRRSAGGVGCVGGQEKE